MQIAAPKKDYTFSVRAWAKKKAVNKLWSSLDLGETKGNLFYAIYKEGGVGLKARKYV